MRQMCVFDGIGGRGLAMQSGATRIRLAAPQLHLASKPIVESLNQPVDIPGAVSYLATVPRL